MSIKIQWSVSSALVKVSSESILNAAKPLVKSAGKYAARTALETAGNIGADLIEGKNLRESAASNARLALEDLKSDTGNFIRNKLNFRNGRKRARPVKKKNPRKKVSKHSRYL